MSNIKTPETIFNNIKNLRFSKENEDVFLASYVESCMDLCKSPIGAYFEKDSLKYTTQKDDDEFVQSAYLLLAKANQNNFAYERFNGLNYGQNLPFIVVFKMTNLECFVALLLDKNQQSVFNELLVRTQLICDIPVGYYQNKPVETMSSNQENNHALEVFNIVIHHNKLSLAFLTLANEIASRFNCSHVSLGWGSLGKFKTKAISKIETFEKNSDVINQLEDVFNEASQFDDVIVYPSGANKIILFDCKKYFEKRNIKQLVSLPIRFEGDIVGVLVCEKVSEDFTAQEINSINLIINQISPWLVSLDLNEKNIFSKLYDGFVNTCRKTFKIEHSFLKLSILAVLVFIVSSFFIKINYRVDGTATLETDFITHIAAPYDGLIVDLKVKEGEEVKKNRLLLTLDKNELRLKANESSSDIVRYEEEAQKARGNQALADMKIAFSKKQEAISSLKRANYYIAKADIKAPYDGIIIEADKKNLVGAPVNKGDIVLKIAKIGSLYLKIKVEEKDIDDLQNIGEFLFLSNPDIVYNIEIDKMMPIAEVDKNQGNVFVLKAYIKHNEEKWWRPGMSGVAKIDVGERTLFWIGTHRITDFIRMNLWW